MNKSGNNETPTTPTNQSKNEAEVPAEEDVALPDAEPYKKDPSVHDEDDDEVSNSALEDNSQEYAEGALQKASTFVVPKDDAPAPDTPPSTPQSQGTPACAVFGSHPLPDTPTTDVISEIDTPMLKSAPPVAASASPVAASAEDIATAASPVAAPAEDIAASALPIAASAEDIADGAEHIAGAAEDIESGALADAASMDTEAPPATYMTPVMSWITSQQPHNWESTRNEFQRTTIQLYSEIITQTYLLGQHLGKAGTAARDAASSAGAAVNSATSSVTASAGTGLGLVIKLLGIGVEGMIELGLAAWAVEQEKYEKSCAAAQGAAGEKGGRSAELAEADADEDKKDDAAVTTAEAV
mmetsp:Transcript_45700/g.76151  ORF Transcript_45700/g.76151 Transcript_45700/m.76151 type:complete len:356 (-) Transcript_45700:172-1239(-)